jgi:hypothetical protein
VFSQGFAPQQKFVASAAFWLILVRILFEISLLFDSGSHDDIFYWERQFFLGVIILFFEYNESLLVETDAARFWLGCLSSPGAVFSYNDTDTSIMNLLKEVWL